VIIKAAKKLHKNIPGALIAVIFGTGLVYIFNLHEAGVSIVKSIPDGLPPFRLPNFDLGKMSELIPLALTISVVAFMEAYSVAKAIEAKSTGYKVVANQELIGLGAANLIGSLFQSYPVTGGFSRSAVNHQAGAVTPLAAIISAALVAVTLLFLTPLFYYLPQAILASIILVAIASLLDIGYARKLWKENKMEFGLLAATFLVTLNFSMVPGIVTGVILSILILLYRSAYPHIAQLGRLKGQKEFRNIHRFKDLECWADKLIIRVDAPLSFINIQFIKEYIEDNLDQLPKVKYILLDASAISQIDASAVQGISDLIQGIKERDVILILTDVVGPVRDTLFKTGLLNEIGTDNVFLTLNNAIAGLNEHDHSPNELALQHN